MNKKDQSGAKFMSRKSRKKLIREINQIKRQTESIVDNLGALQRLVEPEKKSSKGISCCGIRITKSKNAKKTESHYLGDSFESVPDFGGEGEYASQLEPGADFGSLGRRPGGR